MAPAKKEVVTVAKGNGHFVVLAKDVLSPPGKIFELGENGTRFAKLVKELYGTKNSTKSMV